MKIYLSLVMTLLTMAVLVQNNVYNIKIDIKNDKGTLRPIWAFFGYDEPNYTYMKDGKKLLTELAAFSPVPVYVRTHNMLTTGDGTPHLSGDQQMLTPRCQW